APASPSQRGPVTSLRERREERRMRAVSSGQYRAGMADAREIIAEAVVRAAEGELVPRNRRRREPRRLEALRGRAERAADGRRGVDDDDRRAAGVGVDIDEAVEAHLEAALFTRLANCRGRQRLAAVDVAAGKHPLAVARLDRAANENELPAARVDDRADGDLRIDVEHETAARAHGALGLARLEELSLERAAAPRAELVRVRLVVRVKE